MKTKNLAIYQGDTYLFKVAMTSETGEPLQTDGLSFALAVKFPDGTTITPELTVDGNIVSLMFPSALTAAITHTTAEYDLRAISGQYVKTYLRGQLHITPSITPVTAGDGGEIHEEAVSVAVSEAAIIRAVGNQSQTAYDDSELKRRLTALEDRQDQDTVYDDSELKRRLTALENRPAQKAESPYSEIQEGYIARANFGFDPYPMKLDTVYFPAPFSRRPDIFEAVLDVQSQKTRIPFIQNVTESGFDIAIAFDKDLKGVWYRAAILKSQ